MTLIGKSLPEISTTCKRNRVWHIGLRSVVESGYIHCTAKNGIKAKIVENYPLIQRIVQTLESVPAVRVISSDMRDEVSDKAVQGKKEGAAVRLVVSVQDRRADLQLAVRQGGYPRDAREAIWRLRLLTKTKDGSGENRYPLFVAPAISSGARELLQEQGIGYADASGSLFLPLPWAYLFIERPPLPTEERKVKTLFRGSRAQVLHILLSQPEQNWHVQDLASSAEVALSTVHEVFLALEEEGYVERRGKGPEVVRLLREPGRLLDAWAQAHSLQEYRAHGYYAWSQSLPRLRASIGSVLDEMGTPYALTLTSGAELSAPFTTSVETLSILLPKAAPLEEIAERAKLKPVNDGANVTLLLSSSRSPLLCRRKIDDVWVASNIQLYLDLFASPARGKEQAQHLRRERLSF